MICLIVPHDYVPPEKYSGNKLSILRKGWLQLRKVELTNIKYLLYEKAPFFGLCFVYFRTFSKTLERLIKISMLPQLHQILTQTDI